MFRRILRLTRFELKKILGRRVILLPTAIYSRLPNKVRACFSLPGLLLVMLAFLFTPLLLASAYEVFSRALTMTSSKESGDIRNAWVIMANSQKIGTYLLLFFVASVSATAYSEEIEHGTLKTILTKPFRRFELALAKLFSGSFLAVTCALVLALGSFMAGAVFYDFVAVRDSTYPDTILVQVDRLIFQSMIALFLSIPPLLAVYSLGNLISLLVRQSGYAVGALTLVALTCFVVPPLFDLEQYSIFPQCIRPIQQYQDFAGNFTGSRFRIAKEIPGFIAAIVAIIGFQALTIVTFATRDISE